MQRNILKRSVAGLALAAMLGGAALAQTTAPAAPQAQTTQTAPAAPATPVPTTPAPNAAMTAETLPEALRSLNLTELEIKRARQGGSRIEGDMADGTEIDAYVDDAGTLRMIRADDDAALPESVTGAMIPQAVRDNAILSQFATVSAVGLRGDGTIMISGEDEAGEELRAGFNEDGTLMQFGRGDDDRDRGERRGKGHGHGKDKGHGKGMEKGHGGDDRRGDMPRGDGPQGAALTVDAARQALTDAGYTDIGAVLLDGPRTLAEAVNRAGETVTVTLNPRGEVVRETAR